MGYEIRVVRMRRGEVWDFDGWAETYDSAVEASSRIYARYGEVLDAVVEVARVGPGKRVLDIGTGTGNLAKRCLVRGASVVGLDPSEKMLAQARAKMGGHSNADLVQADEPFLRIPFPDAYFDAVVSTYAFHHVPHHLKPASVREMVRVIVPGGLWAIGDLAFADEPAERRALQKYPWLEEEYFARIEELRRVFMRLGMELGSKQFTPVTWVLWAKKPVKAAL